MRTRATARRNDSITAAIELSVALTQGPRASTGAWTEMAIASIESWTENLIGHQQRAMIAVQKGWTEKATAATDVWIAEAIERIVVWTTKAIVPTGEWTSAVGE